MKRPQDAFLEGLIAKLPMFDVTWADSMKLAWFEHFHDLLQAARPPPPLAPEPQAVVSNLWDHVRRYRRAAHLATNRREQANARRYTRLADELEQAATLIALIAALPAASGGAQGSERSDEGNPVVAEHPPSSSTEGEISPEPTHDLSPNGPSASSAEVDGGDA